MTLFLVDVSKYQEPADWPRVVASGISGVIARASIGTVGDAAYRGHVTNADRAGVPFIGAYHYLYPRRFVSPEAQADKFLSVVGDTRVSALALDTEYNKSAPYLDREDVRRFTERIAAKAPGFRLLQYAPRWYVTGYMGNPDLSGYGPLWQSRYVSTRGLSPQQLYAAVPSTYWRADWGRWTSVSLLQFTSGARVPGFSDLVDCSAFRGTLSELYALTFPLPDSSTEDPVKIEPKAEEWIAVNGNGVFRAEPDRGSPVIARVPDGKVILSIGEVQTLPPTDPNFATRGNWRLTRFAGNTAYMLRSDWQPVVQGGDPALDAALTAFIEDPRADRIATIKRKVAAFAADIEDD